MNVLSLFDGISAGQLALSNIGIIPEKYYASEIHQPSIKITQNNFPSTIQLGDVTKWREWDIDWSKIDLLLGGTPCQGFSFGGKQLAFDDPRSVLFFEYVNILEHIREHNPNVKFFLENVKMRQEFLDVITKYLKEDDFYVSSKLVCAQERKRHYWFNWDAALPEDKGITWKDIRDNHNCTFFYTERSIEWLKNYNELKHIPFNELTDEQRDLLYTTKPYEHLSNERMSGTFPEFIDNSVGAMRGRYIVDNKRQDGKQKTAGLTQQYAEFRYDGKTNALTTVPKDNIVVPFNLPNRVPLSQFFFRYLTVTECEKLQTFPIGYTSGISNSQRTKALGNGWTVDIISHILSHANLNG